MSFGPLEPDPWSAMPQAERDRRGQISDDACIIDGEEFYVRGCIELPIVGTNDRFVWLVWVSVSEKSFERIGELWDIDIRETEPPFFGWLANELPIYPETRLLKTNLHPRNRGQRPFIELEPTGHPLAVEQREGISLKRVEEIASALLLHS